MQKQFFIWMKTVFVFAAVFIVAALGITVYAFFCGGLGIDAVIVVSAISLFIAIISVFLAKYYFSMMENFSVSYDIVYFTGYKKSAEKKVSECKRINVKQRKNQCCFVFDDGSKIVCQYKYFPGQADKLSYDLITRINFPAANIILE